MSVLSLHIERPSSARSVVDAFWASLHAEHGVDPSTGAGGSPQGEGDEEQALRGRAVFFHEARDGVFATRAAAFSCDEDIGERAVIQAAAEAARQEAEREAAPQGLLLTTALEGPAGQQAAGVVEAVVDELGVPAESVPCLAVPTWGASGASIAERLQRAGSLAGLLACPVPVTVVPLHVGSLQRPYTEQHLLRDGVLGPEVSGGATAYAARALSGLTAPLRAVPFPTTRPESRLVARHARLSVKEWQEAVGSTGTRASRLVSLLCTPPPPLPGGARVSALPLVLDLTRADLSLSCPPGAAYAALDSTGGGCRTRCWPSVVVSQGYAASHYPDVPVHMFDGYADPEASDEGHRGRGGGDRPGLSYFHTTVAPPGGPRVVLTRVTSHPSTIFATLEGVLADAGVTRIRKGRGDEGSDEDEDGWDTTLLSRMLRAMRSSDAEEEGAIENVHLAIEDLVKVWGKLRHGTGDC